MQSLINKFLDNIDTKDLPVFFILLIFPLIIILGNLAINLIFIISVFSFSLNLKENLKYYNNLFVKFVFFFFIALLITVFFSTNSINSLPRVIKLLFVIALLIEVLRITHKYNFKIFENIFFLWTIIFIIVLFDCYFEIIFGFNLIGNKSLLSTRISSFFGEELVVGSFIFCFAIYAISFLIYRKVNTNVIILFLILILIGSFLIGERSNFIKLFFSIIIIVFTSLNIARFKKILYFSLLLLSLTFIFSINEKIQYRYYHEIKIVFENDGLKKYLKESQYGAHQNTAINIFKKYPLFGVGIKNFRNESLKEDYIDESYKSNSRRFATHPHQVHLEFLSETGLFGYIAFLIFIISSIVYSIINNFKKPSLFRQAAILYVIFSLLPVIPSGSFLSTFNSSFFWLSYIVMAYPSKINPKINQ